MEDEKPINIAITGKITYQEQITTSQAAKIIAFIDSTAVEVFAGSPGSPQTGQLIPMITPGDQQREVSTPRGALDLSGAKTSAEKIATFAKLLLDGGQTDFTLEDIKPLFRQARESAPANLSRDLERVIKTHKWAVPTEVKGEYFLTQKGITDVESGFRNGQAAKKTRKTSTHKVRRLQLETPDVFADLDEVPQEFEGTLPYTHLKQGTDRLLWVVAMSKSLLNLEGLSNQEVVWLTEKLGAPITPNNVNSTFNAAKKKLRVNRMLQTNKIRITPGGEDYLRSLKDERGA